MAAESASKREGPAEREASGPGVHARLQDVVLTFPDSGYAVLDGGLFEDLPAELRRVGLLGRSLFLDHADSEIEKAGPWLVGLDQAEDAPARVFGLVGDRPGAVFWSCAGGEMVLHRHLRTLNMARIPVWAANGAGEPPAAEAENYDVVMFRHWDPRVLGALLPVLDAGQFTRVIGPAREVAFAAPDFGGLKRVVADPAWPQAPLGMLTIRGEQIDALTGRRLSVSHDRIMRYLRDVAPAETAGVADEALRTHVSVSDRWGRRLGLESEAAHARWAFLTLKTGGRILHEPVAMRFIANGPNGPDQQVKELVSATAVALRERGTMP